MKLLTTLLSTTLLLTSISLASPTPHSITSPISTRSSDEPDDINQVCGFKVKRAASAAAAAAAAYEAIVDAPLTARDGDTLFIRDGDEGYVAKAKRAAEAAAAAAAVANEAIEAELVERDAANHV